MGFTSYCKTCIKRPLSKRPQTGFQDQLFLNVGQKYCRMLQGEHSAILLTFIKLLFVNIYILSVVALDETNISAQCKTLECHVIYTTPLCGVTSTTTNDVLCLSTFAYCFSLPGFSNTSVANEIFHFIRITDGVGRKIVSLAILMFPRSPLDFTDIKIANVFHHPVQT